LTYKLPITIKPISDKKFMARCEPVRATATGETPEEALHNLQESIQEMVKEFGESIVFQDITPETDVRVIEVSM